MFERYFAGFGEQQVDGLAGPFQNVHARLKRFLAGVFCVVLDIFPAPAAVGFKLKAERFQQDRAAKFGDRLRAPVLAAFGQVSEPVVCRVKQFMRPCGKILDAQGEVSLKSVFPLGSALLAVVCVHVQAPRVRDSRSRAIP